MEFFKDEYFCHNYTISNFKGSITNLFAKKKYSVCNNITL